MKSPIRMALWAASGVTMSFLLACTSTPPAALTTAPTPTDNAALATATPTPATAPAAAPDASTTVSNSTDATPPAPSASPTTATN